MAFLTHYGIKINTFLKKHCRHHLLQTPFTERMLQEMEQTQKKRGAVFVAGFLFLKIASSSFFRETQQKSSPAAI